MHLRRLLADAGPWPLTIDVERALTRVTLNWRGCRVWMTIPACRLAWRRANRPPAGAAERLASDIEAAIRAEGGGEEHVRRVLAGCMAGYLEV